MFIAIIQAVTTAFGGFCSTLALAACVSTTIETPADHPARASAAHEHADGHEHYHHLEAAPPQSARGVDEASAAARASAGSWTCPMHPEVSSDEPGRCSTCGMKLVEKEKSPPSETTND
jgi:hypothetical protein